MLFYRYSTETLPYRQIIQICISLEIIFQLLKPKNVDWGNSINNKYITVSFLNVGASFDVVKSSFIPTKKSLLIVSHTKVTYYMYNITILRVAKLSEDSILGIRRHCLHRWYLCVFIFSNAWIVAGKSLCGLTITILLLI